MDENTEQKEEPKGSYSVESIFLMNFDFWRKESIDFREKEIENKMKSRLFLIGFFFLFIASSFLWSFQTASRPTLQTFCFVNCFASLLTPIFYVKGET